MKLKDYLSDRKIVIFLNFLMLILVECILFLFNTTLTEQIFIGTVIVLILTISFIYDFRRKSSFYNQFVEKINQLPEKYLISEMIECPDFLEGRFLYDQLLDITKCMNDKIEEHIRISNEFKNYVEIWVHEIKIPIAGMKLMIHNSSDSSRKLKAQIDKIDSYVEQVLYYIRSEVPQNDYVISKHNILDIVDFSIKSNRDILILNKFQIKKDIINRDILTDEKWLSFMLNQIISNAVKYSNDNNHCISFYTTQKDNQIILHIEDNGIGITDSDLPRVFDKSFTGQNGRIISSSTGMGLYLCKRLCKELGHEIEIESKKNEWTRVSILFKN